MVDPTGGASADGVPRIGASRSQTALFATALAAGTAATILGKILLGMPARTDAASDGAEAMEPFARPVALTLGMFLGLMVTGLLAHVVVVVWRIPCPGYAHHRWRAAVPPTEPESEASPLLPRDPASLVPWWMYAYLAIPAAFDVLATSIALLGLLHLDASSYQLLRGSGIVFLALLKQNALGQRLYFFQWYGVVWSTLAVTLVAGAALIGARADPRATVPAAVGGVACLLLSTLVQSAQVVLEDKMMKDDAPNLPPLLLLGVEGLWGSLLCALVLYPLAILFPGSDHGSFENIHTTWHMLAHTPSLQLALGLYIVFACVYNVLSLLLTVSLSSVWHFILNNIQPTTVWATDLLIYYAITHHNYGEPWDHRSSWVQLVGLLALLYGTLIFNAPDPPSLRLEGQWYALGLNLTPEYAEIELQRNPAVPGLVKWLGSALGRRLKFG